MPTTTGDVGPHLARLVDFVHELGIRLQCVDDLQGAVGRRHPGGQSIDILDSLTPPKTFATLTHEAAHELLNRRDDPPPSASPDEGAPARPQSRAGHETEAEAEAGIVAQAIGWDHLDFSCDYIRLYCGDAMLLQASLGRIQRTATAILTAVLGESVYAPSDSCASSSPMRASRSIIRRADAIDTARLAQDRSTRHRNDAAQTR